MAAEAERPGSGWFSHLLLAAGAWEELCESAIGWVAMPLPLSAKVESLRLGLQGHINPVLGGQR